MTFPAGLLQRLSRLIGSSGPDTALLDRFLLDHDEAAFTALVERHGPMVFRVCRRLLADRQAAEDAFQATFLVLARQARSIRHPSSLAAWLHGVAHRVALKVRTAEVRRQQRLTGQADQDPTDPRPDPLAEVSAREVLTILDDEVARLPSTQQSAVILCCLEGLTLEQAAQQLGWTRNTVKGLLERGRRKLHARLLQRGLTLTAVLALVELFRHPASASLAPALVTATAPAALAFASGQELDPTQVSPQVQALAEGTVRALVGWRRALAAGLLLTLVLGLAAGAGHLARPPHPPEMPPQEEASTASEPEQARVDRYGDPLPDRVVARLGTVRLRGVRGCLTFSPDGKVLATSGGSAGDQIVLWDAGTGRESRRLVSGSPTLAHFAFSPDGQRVICSGNARTCRVVEVATDKELFSVAGSQGAFTPDGQTIVSVDAFGPKARVRLADAATGRPLSDWPISEGADQVQLAADGHTLALVERAFPDDVMIHDLRTRQLRRSFHLWEGTRLMGIALAADGKTLASAHPLGVQLWDVVSGSGIRQWNQRADSAPVFSQDGRLLAWTGYDERLGIARLWVVEVDGQTPRAVGPPVNAFERPCFSPDSRSVAVVTDGHAVQIRQVTDGKEVVRLDAHESPVLEVAFTSDGQGVVSRARDGVFAWETLTGRLLHRNLIGDVYGEYIAAVLPNGRLLTAERTANPLNGLFRLRDPQTGQELWRFEGRPDGGEIAVAPGGRYVALSGRATPFQCILDLTTGQSSYRFEPEAAMFGQKLSADGQVLVGYCREGEKIVVRVHRHGVGKDLVLRDLARGNSLENWLRQPSCVSPDGRWLLLDDQAGRLRRWDLTTGKEEAPLADAQRSIWQLVWSPDGRFVVARGSERRGKGDDPEATWDARGWDLLRGTRLAHLTIPRASDCLRFLPDNRMLLTTDLEGVIHLWEVATGKERLRLTGHKPGEIGCATLSPDGRLLASGGYDSQILVWDLTGRMPDGKWRTMRQTPEQLQRAWEALAGPEAGPAWTAAWSLAADPEGTTALLRDRLRPVPRLEVARVRRLVGQLASDEFDVRNRAEHELEELGEGVLPELRMALAGAMDLEAQARLRRLIERLDPSVPFSRVLQALRAIEVLEWVGTPEARQLLQRLAEGAEEAQVTRAARASCQRLTKR
jgi:RNA polymerase sigma factor (sigma-70 family)